MIQAVIFDCFGVLTTDGWKALRQEFFGSERADWPLEMDKAVNMGVINYDEFIAKISDKTGLSINEIRDRMNHPSPNTVLLDFIRNELKPQHKIGMLSNAADNWLGDFFTSAQNELFDQVVLSYQVGMVKPDPRMYDTIAMRLGVANDECLFVDDIERYCTAAKDQGMTTIWHQNTEQTIAEIQRLLDA